MEAKAPDKLYIICDAANNRGMTVATEKPMFSDDICYIRKDALLEWAKQKQYESLTIVADNFWQEVIDKLNSM